MDNRPFGWKNLTLSAFLAVLVIIMALITKSVWFSGAAAAISILTLGAILSRFLASKQRLSTIRKLYDNEKFRDYSIASRILAGIVKDSSSSRSLQKNVADCIAKKFDAAKFAIFFRDGDKYVPRAYLNVNPRFLNIPRPDMLGDLIKKIPGNGGFINDESIGELLIKRKSFEEFKSPYIFYYGWGKSRSVIIVSEGRRGLLSEALQYNGFNAEFWPALDILLRQDEKRRQGYKDFKKIRNEYSRSRQDLLNAGKEIKRRISDLNSFMDMSEDFYSILDENHLFAKLRETIGDRIGAGRVVILNPGKNDEYISDGVYNNSHEDESHLVLKDESELFEMLTKHSKPLLLPLAASGLNEKNDFLDSALRSKFQIVAPLGLSKKPDCVLLIGEKKNNSQYDESDLNFLSVIVNIASLSLANIRHFKTIEKLSYTDSMTGIYNYRYFYKRLGEEILRAKRYTRDISLVILDIDNFKQFNDKYGHQTGDMVLKRTAELITGAIRSIDIVSRYGGEEFCIIMPDTGENSGSAFIERLKNNIADFRFKSGAMNDETSITVSVGCSVFPQHASARDRLIYCADMALLKAKSLGRNKAIMYQPDIVENQFFPRRG